MPPPAVLGTDDGEPLLGQGWAGCVAPDNNASSSPVWVHQLRMSFSGSELITPEHKRPYNLDQKALPSEVLISALLAALGRVEPGALCVLVSPLPLAAVLLKRLPVSVSLPIKSQFLCL